MGGKSASHASFPIRASPDGTGVARLGTGSTSVSLHWAATTGSSTRCATFYSTGRLGGFHFTPGQAYEDAGNGNRSQLHWDMVCIRRKACGGGEIRFDGKLIRKNGIFLPKPLAKLNP